MNREQKAAKIEEIAAQIEGAAAIFAIDYRGISVAQAAELRGKLRGVDASFWVVKNRLTKLAAEKAGEERLGEWLEGPTALTFVRGDTAMAAKAISTFNKEHDVLTFKGGFMEGLSLDEDKFKSIARLPAREVLDGQLAGIVASPLTGLVRGLGSMIQGLALQLGQIAEKGLVSGGSAAEDSAEATPAGPGAVDDSSASRDDAAGEESSSAPPTDEASTEEASPDETPEDKASDDDGPGEEEPAAEQGGDEPPAEEAKAEEADEATDQEISKEEEE